MAKVQGALDEARTAAIVDSYEADPKNTVVRHALSRNPSRASFMIRLL
jgi:hypothetical protein